MTVAQIIAGLRKLSDPSFVRTRQFQLLVFELYRYLMSVVLKKRGNLAAIAGDRQISTPAAEAVKLRAA